MKDYNQSHTFAAQVEASIALPTEEEAERAFEEWYVGKVGLVGIGDGFKAGWHAALRWRDGKAVK